MYTDIQSIRVSSVKTTLVVRTTTIEHLSAQGNVQAY